MKLTLAFAVISMSSISVFAADPQTGSGETDGYRLVWQDLFDAETINDLRWNIEENGDGGGNAELQYYVNSDKNIRLGDDGNGNHCLILTARRESYKGKSFTSGRLNSRNFVTFTHGKIEAAIKLPSTADGLWPAFWMMGNDYGEVGWPRCGETDILEMGHSNGMRNGTQDRFFNGACHWGQAWPNASYAKDSTHPYSLQDGEFHLFTCIWDEDYIRMYVDLDKYPEVDPYYEIKITCDDPGNEWSAGNYFHKDNFIIFNLAIGGNFPGIHNANGITALNDANGHEASMYVNYVKVYQKEDASHTFFSAVESDPQPGHNGLDNSLADNNTPTMRVEGETLKISSEGEITVFNTGGAVVAQATAAGEISLAHLPKGIYLAVSGNSYLKFAK